MAFSIYHFFADLCLKKDYLCTIKKLDEFPFNTRMLSCINNGLFPDLAIKLNQDNLQFSGGELVELKDSKNYSVASFNSTIPTGEKDIRRLITGDTNTIRKQMQEAGDEILSLPIRQVFYLIRGKNKSNLKVCLTHGKFFETVPVSELISESFSQALEERLDEIGESMSESMREKLLDLFSEQQTFSKTRKVKDASVNLRFRIMTAVKAEGNILNSKQYHQIVHNTMNFAIPCHDENERIQQENKMRIAFDEMDCKDLFYQMNIFDLQHHFNGNFLIFQFGLPN